MQPISSGTNREWKKHIESVCSVGVHVRRGDYTKQGWTLPFEYYQRAIETIYSTVEGVELFFFSDQIEWVRDHIEYLLPDKGPSSPVHFVDCNDAKDALKELTLMRSCRHNIIANSTFSWWGAWLNQNEHKIILAPSYWIQNRVRDLALLPKEWTTVDW